MEGVCSCAKDKKLTKRVYKTLLTQACFLPSGNKLKAKAGPKEPSAPSFHSDNLSLRTHV